MSYSEQPPIPGYEPIRLLAINLGAVYLARHSSSGVLVALKVWHLKFAEHAQAGHAGWARLHHPNIIRVLEMGEFEGSFFCAVEVFERTLADRLREGPLSSGEVARLGRAVGSALQYALDQGMIPSSLSPDSIALTDEGVPKLPDFRAAGPFANPRDLMLFPNLWSPELVRGAKTVSEASLVFCVGVLMYELLTSRRPFRADRLVAWATRLLRHTPEQPRKLNPAVSRGFDAVCMKCLAKEPEARYASLQDLMEALKRFQSL